MCERMVVDKRHVSICSAISLREQAMMVMSTLYYTNSYEILIKKDESTF
jgi:hypothetical protein